MNDLPPVSRHRSKSHRSHVTSPMSRDNQQQARDSGNSRNSRDTARERGTDYLRELTRERPPDSHSDRNWATPPTLRREQVELVVDSIFSAHSDGLMVILRKSSVPSPPLPPATPSQNTFTYPPPMPPPLTRPSRSDDSTRSSGSSSAHSESSPSERRHYSR